jgi:predicted dinucleotide-binding enzyme
MEVRASAPATWRGASAAACSRAATTSRSSARTPSVPRRSPPTSAERAPSRPRSRAIRIEGEVVVLAVYYPDARVAAEPSADELAGKVLVDITSRVNETFNGLVVTPDGPTTAEVAALVGGARFVKAFDTTFATTLMAGEVAGHKLDVLIAGDDEDAKGKVGAGARRRAQPDRRRLAERSARARGGRPASHRTPEHARNRLRKRPHHLASP